MTHRTYRSLDEKPRLLGFTLTQWLMLLALAGAAVALTILTGLPLKAAVSLCAFAVGLPGALAYVSEAGGIRWLGLARDLVCWLVRRKRFAAMI